jgi:hypothetical protein
MPTIAVDARAYEEAVSVVVSVEWLSDSDHDKHLAFIAAMDRLLQQGERMLLRLNFVVFRDTFPKISKIAARLNHRLCVPTKPSAGSRGFHTGASQGQRLSASCHVTRGPNAASASLFPVAA